MSEIMKKPKCVDNSPTSYFTGQQILNKFYSQSGLIPEELKERNWRPEEDKTYKCWWYWTTSSTPADSGMEILLYIEEVNSR